MIWIGFQIILYVIIAFDRFDASELATSGNSDSNNHLDLPIINAVKPIKNVKYLSFNSILSVIRSKLREAFVSQHPYSKYNLLAYDIENWPSGVSTFKSKYWHKNDILLINERIPYLRFIPKKKIPELHDLTDMNSSTSATLKKDSHHKPSTRIRKKILERFKLETGQLSATKIDWKMLDPSHIPKKYEKIILCSKALGNSLMYNDPEIVDNIHFYPFSNVNEKFDEYFSSGDEISDSSNSDGNDDTNIYGEKGNTNSHGHEVSPAFKFQDSEVISRSNNDISGREDEFEIDGLFDLYDKFMEDQETIVDNSENYKYITAGFEGIDSQALKSQPIRQDSMNFENICAKRKLLKMELRKLFESQHPDEELVYRNYEILNWPEGVGNIWDYWSRSEIEKIRGNMDKFIFKKRSKPFSMAMELGFDKLGNLDGILNKSMTYKSTMKTLLARYRVETGDLNAPRIRWNKVDRRDIPAKYDGVEISKTAMTLKKFYKNPEIVNNIHFYKIIDYVRLQRKRKFDDVTV